MMNEMDEQKLVLVLNGPLREKAEKSIACMYGVGFEKSDGLLEWIETRGTGLFLKISERIFLITCRHILDLKDEDGRENVALGIGQKHTPVKILMDQLDLTHTNPQDDVAIFELNDQQISLLNRNAALKPLALENIQPFYFENGIDRVSVVGFPIALARTDLRKKEIFSQAMIFSSYITYRKPSSLTLYDFSKHLLIEFDPEHHFDLHDNSISELPPFGFSGAPVWAVRANKKQSDIWTPDDLKIIGIATTWLDADKEVRITRISVLLKLMAEKWPELEEVFSKEFEAWQP